MVTTKTRCANTISRAIRLAGTGVPGGGDGTIQTRLVVGPRGSRRSTVILGSTTTPAPLEQQTRDKI
jgi:hypothetical protein